MSGFARSDVSPIAEWWRTVDKTMLSALLALIAVGMLTSLAASPAAAQRLGEAPYYYVYRQGVFAFAAMAVLIGGSILSPVWVRRVAGVVFIGAFMMMAAVLLIGHEAKGAQRWIRLAGFSFQPSELVKPSLIILTAWLLAQRERFPKAPWAFMAFAFYAATVGLLLMQPDVGQSILLTAVFAMTFFVSGMSVIWAVSMLIGGLTMATSLYALLPHVRFRVNSFLDPAQYDTYQVDKARQALERGGLLGAGIGEGEVKHSLPDAHTDFIYSVIGEEYGLVVCFSLILVFAVITMRGMIRASNHPDPYPRAAGVGLFALFGLQAAINIGVNVSLIPNKGMTLPFISYGGSSLMGSALTLGLALALTRRRPDFSMRQFVSP